MEIVKRECLTCTSETQAHKTTNIIDMREGTVTLGSPEVDDVEEMEEPQTVVTNLPPDVDSLRSSNHIHVQLFDGQVIHITSTALEETGGGDKKECEGVMKPDCNSCVVGGEVGSGGGTVTLLTSNGKTYILPQPLTSTEDGSYLISDEVLNTEEVLHSGNVLHEEQMLTISPPPPQSTLDFTSSVASHPDALAIATSEVFSEDYVSVPLQTQGHMAEQSKGFRFKTIDTENSLEICDKIYTHSRPDSQRRNNLVLPDASIITISAADTGGSDDWVEKNPCFTSKRTVKKNMNSETLMGVENANHPPPHCKVKEVKECSDDVRQIQLDPTSYSVYSKLVTLQNNEPSKVYTVMSPPRVSTEQGGMTEVKVGDVCGTKTTSDEELLDKKSVQHVNSDHVQEGNSKLDLQNNTKLRRSSRIRKVKNIPNEVSALEIENVATTDDGEYYCQASSLDKSKVSQQATLKVEEAYALRDPQRPVFIAQPKSAVGKVGDNITLDCAANGYPEPTVVWLKDGATIDMAHLDTRFLFFGTTRSLQIIGLKEEDKGTYMCRAENREDSVDAVAHIQVQVAPRFVKQPVSTLAYEKEDVELECNVYGEPEPSVYWLKNGELLVETEYFQIVSGNNLKILGLVREDSGMYQCVAHNSAGDTQAAAQLRVLKSRRSMPSDPTATTTAATLTQGIPEGGSYLPEGEDSDGVHHQASSAPRLLQAIIASNRFITLAWHEPALNNDHIVGYSVFYKQEGSLRERVQNVSASSSSEGLDEYKTQISDLIPGSNYMVRVVAHTSSGLVGASTPDVRVSTKPDLDLPSAPENLKVVPTSPTSLEVTWSPPRVAKTPITGYTMFYMQVGSAEEHEVDVIGTSYDLQGLDQFTEYSVWLTAVNTNGRGDATPEVTARTFSDVPSKEPQNVTVEAASSRSLIIRWEPPPADHQNGIITGYKIRYKERGKSGSSKTRTTDGNRRLFPLTDLKKSTTYSIKLAALTVNGTGPYTQSSLAETFANDLDENRVPDKPVGLKAVALTDHIRVRWQPPAQHNVMLRGYTIHWGRGVPDTYSKIVDSKQRTYIIDKLQPNTEYVISLRAYNTVGDGQPVYEQVRTRPEEEEVAPTLDPPVGVKAVVLTPFTVALQWTDTTLNRNQYITDTRYYTVRYTTFSSASSSSPRFRYINATDVTCLIDNLRPSTVFEFAVKTVKGRRESPWSLVASNTTLVARPSSPPRDVTVVTIRDEPSTVIFNWQPPKQNNGKITGYVIFYTTDPTVSDWVMENVMGDRMTFTVRGLTPSTQYFYKMHARNVKGFGPFSSVGNFTTLPAVGKSIGEPPGWFVDRGSLIVLVIAGAAGAVVLLGAFVAITLYCRKTKTEPRPSIVVGSCSKSNKPDVQPPDLWIHHDHLELKNFDKGERSSSPNHAAIINHTGPEYEPDDKNTTYTSTSTLDRRTPYQSTYLRDQLSEDETDKLLNRRSFKPKPLIMSMDVSRDLVGGSTSSSVYSDGTLGRPGYSMPQFSSAGSQGYNSPAENPYSPNPTSSGVGASLGPSTTPLEGLSLPPQPSQSLLGSLGGPSGSSQYSTINGEGSNTLGKRSGNPLRSFSVPAPPQSAPTTPQPKHIVAVRPQGITSPFKKSLVPGSSGLSSSAGPGGPSGRWTGPSMRVDSLPEHEEANEALLHGYSTEELSQEMANLEGLMKDLSAITANQFNC